jgi:hypothetical protein
VIKHSKLYDVIQEVSKENKQIKSFCKKLFIDYFCYITRVDNQIKKAELTIIEAIKQYERDTEILEDEYFYKSQAKKIVNPQNKMTKEHIDNYKDLVKRIKTYKKHCESIANTILMSFNDLYMLFKSWRYISSDNIYPCLTIYNAGDSHCDYLRVFLSNQKNLYSASHFSNYSSDVYITNNTIDQTKRCLDLSDPDEIINMDYMIIENIIMQKEYFSSQVLEDFKKKLNLVQNRINLLNPILYKEMLNGRLFSKEEMQSICEEEDLKSCFEQTSLSSLSYSIGPDEYNHKHWKN